MHHSMIDFILDLKNIQTINKRKTQDCYIITHKQFDLNFVLFFKNILLFCYKENKQTALKQLLVFLLCLVRKTCFLSKMLTLRIEKKNLFFADLQTVFFMLPRLQTNKLNSFHHRYFTRLRNARSSKQKVTCT